MLSLPKQIPIQLLLCKICLTQPGTAFVVSQMKKACLKQPQKTLSSEEMQSKLSKCSMLAR